VVEDYHAMADVLCDVLRAAGYRVLSAGSGMEALECVRREEPDLLISDLRMAEMGGHQLQTELKRMAPSLPVIIITAFGSIESAVESMKLGAVDYITKPFGNDQLLLVVSRALENRQLRQEVARLRSELTQSYGLPNVITASPKMSAVLEMIEQVAESGCTVLICGESGTGKDLRARTLHFSSARRDAPFIPINCAAIPENLIESELFGYIKGAFTDARQGKTGLFVAAHQGTLFLDEISEMPLALQPKLLRTIEDKQVRPLGATDEIPVDVRIVAATNSDLEKTVAAGKFRSDLYYRLATITIAVPPLRERPEDIPLLVKHSIVRASAEAGKPMPKVEPEAMACMVRYRWPGNVRELRSVVHRGVILCRGGALKVRDLPARVVDGSPGSAKILEDALEQRLSLERFESEYVRAVLESVNGNKAEAAKILQIDRKTLYRKLEQLQSVVSCNSEKLPQN
jgi:two-component system response regulator HydG